jgi:hypothetical protein
MFVCLSALKVQKRIGLYHLIDGFTNHSISCYISLQPNIFLKSKKALAFNQDGAAI